MKEIDQKRVQRPNNFSGTPTWVRFIVCTPQYGHRDVTCKQSIPILK